MWRDRTNLFISYRQSYSHHPTKRPAARATYGDPSSVSDERRGLMSPGAFDDGDGDVVIEMDLLPPRWLDVQDEVSEHLAEVATHTRKLDQLHARHVLPGFEDEAVKKREEREIEHLTQLITRKFHASQKAIQRIELMVAESQQSSTITRSEETMAHNLKISLATRVGEASTLFRKKQSTYLRKLRTLGGLSSPGPGASTPVQNPYNDPALTESETDRSFSQTTLQQAAQQRQLYNNDSLISQREREIEDIAKGIIDLSNIFQELNTMVIDQGSLLDRIDYNVEVMGQEVKEADRELTVATNYQRKTIKRKIMLLLIIVIAGLIILLSLKLSGRSGSPDPIPPSVPDEPVPPQPMPPPDLPARLRRRFKTLRPLPLMRSLYTSDVT